MKEWFLSRTPRERLILTIGAAAAVVIVGWGFVWSPLSNGVERLDASLAAQTRLLVDARTAAAIAPGGGGSARPQQSLYVVVDGAARAHGVNESVTRTRQDGTTGLDVTFQAAPFDALLAWLVTLETEHGVSVETATITATREPGLVNGQVLLRRY